METLYLFTDGGLFDLNEDTMRMVSSYILTTRKEIISRKTFITAGGTTPRAEALAFLKGVNELRKYVDDIPDSYKLYIITDSELNYKTFTQWVYGWIKRAGGIDKEWKGASGTAVKNQDVHKFSLAHLNHLKKKNFLAIQHINSHVTKVEYKEKYERFNTINKEDISEEQFSWYLYINTLVDQDVKEYGRDKTLIPKKQ